MIGMKTTRPPKTRGRPRAFEAEKALEQAMRVFWEKGYEGASLPDLTKAMNINRPSLYAAFGNKEDLFRKCIDRYVSGPAAYIREALTESTARAVFESLLRRAADLVCGGDNPRGCLIVQGALCCAEDADPVRRELASRRAAAQKAIRERFVRARAEGDLPESIDPGDLACFVSTLINGIAVQAAGGATKKDLRRIAETAVRSWPLK